MGTAIHSRNRGRYRLIETTVLASVFGAFCIGLRAEEGDSQSEQVSESQFTQKERSHWAFQPIVRPEIPAVRESERVRSPIDRFIHRRLENNGLTFSAPAEKRELLRRAKYDLLGLPPTPEEIEQFLADETPDAFERLIDGFLASPQYGETWGRYWLDLVRFAETAGFNADPDRPLAYKYRDYVIQSFNDDKPYDRFVQEQIAGDELFPEIVDALIATGYNRMWPDESNASDVLLARQDALNDLTANFGSVFLGISIGCAQCHDHKFDPILQTDFYQLQSFFAGIVLEDRVPLGTQKQLVEYRRKLDEWYKSTDAVRNELHNIEMTAKAKAAHIKRLKFPDVVLKAIDTAPEKRSAFQRQLVFWSERQIELTDKQIVGKLTKEERKRREELIQQIEKLLKSKPQPPRFAKVMATREVAGALPKTHLLAGGSYTSPEQELKPGFLSILKPGESNVAEISSPRPGTSGRRATLARWMTDPRNPLTARVMVNRIWQGHFGKGLVENANDFGFQTRPPTHPELLDWLAAEFINPTFSPKDESSSPPLNKGETKGGWSIKRMHRLIMTSAAYRQATFRRTDDQTLTGAVEVDSENTLYWHFPRQRLTAERIRDSLLFVSGQLSSKMYGYGVKPELPPNFSARHAWKPSNDESDRNRRSVYIYAKRNLPYPLMKAFDLPDMHESCARRAETTIAPQALTLLNSDLILQSATAFANWLLEKTPTGDLPKLVTSAYETAFGRDPTQDEIASAVEFIQQQAKLIADEKKQNKQKSLKSAYVDFCHALLNANEFVYLE